MIVTEPTVTSGSEPRTASRTVSVYKSIRSEILNARLLPGARLHVADLASRYDVSAASVREALSRLVADGLATAIDQRGFRVCPVSIDDLLDLTRLRVEIEALALADSIRLATPAWEGAIVGCFHELALRSGQSSRSEAEQADWEACHQRFHYSLVAACASPRLLGLRESLVEQSDRYRKLATSYLGVKRDVMAEHQALMDAVIQRDSVEAIRLVKAHFSHTTDLVMAVLNSA